MAHRQHRSDGVLSRDDERAAVPEGQSVGHVHHGVGEAHSNVHSDGLFYPHVFCPHQVLVVSVPEEAGM